MTVRWRMQTGWVVLAAASVMGAGGQVPEGGTVAMRSPNTTTAFTQAADQDYGSVVREIEDAQTGDQWLLLRNADHPAGPGRLVRVESAAARNGSAQNKDAQEGDERKADAARLLPVIHAGDPVIVEEHSTVVDARLEGVALGPAAVGSVFKARLKIGGKVVPVIAVAAGRAELAPWSEAWP